jgi:trk family K+ transporter, NAD+ binding protein
VDYTPVRDCIIVGGGRISYYIARYIEETHLNMRLKIIDSNKERCEYLADVLPDSIIINGDGIDPELLKKEGIENTDAFCSLTGFDEENIMLSLYAGKLSNARLITKINRIAFENVTKEMNLGSVIYPKQIVAESIVRYVRALENSKGSNVETLYKIADGLAEALEFKVLNDPDLINIPFSQMAFKQGVLICGIIRQNKIITPRGADVMKVGDRVIVVTTNAGFNDLRDILEVKKEEDIHYEL